jgi:hypothetical protein
VGNTQTKDNTRPAVDQLLTDVTTTSDGCTDTITFRFQPNAEPMPGYQVEYADPPFITSAGQAVTPAGTGGEPGTGHEVADDEDQHEDGGRADQHLARRVDEHDGEGQPQPDDGEGAGLGSARGPLHAPSLPA